MNFTFYLDKNKLAYILLYFIITLLFSFNIHAQNNIDVLKKAYKRLDSVEVNSFQSEHFFNKGFFFGQGLDPYIKFAETPTNNNFIISTPSKWKKYYKGVYKAGIKDKKDQNLKDISSIIDSYPNDGNVIPIAILQAEGEWLEEYDIDENIKAKKKGYQLSKEYKKFNIFSASVLKQKVYDADVSFEIVPELFEIRKKANVKNLSIDLADGQGFREINSGDVINTSYNSIGEKAIAVKFELSDDEFISYSIIDVVTLEKELPDLTFDLTTNFSNNRTNSLSGGTAELFNGCDDIFDKPVIIVEGFDPNNERSILDINDTYRDALIEESFRANGYDVIYLDFDNGGADIRTNGQVLQDLIVDVNTQKSGNSSIIIIGESMGGLVTRWALTDMEQDGIIHNVSHFISFDSPHLGANIPVGFQDLVEDMSDVDFFELFNVEEEEINKALTSLNSTAAKQMLLRYKGTSPHSEFTSLQNELASLGFPQQNNIRNISIINASGTGSNQEPVDDFSPNDPIYSVDFISIASLLIDVRTNQINGSTKTSALWILTGDLPTTIKEHTYSFDSFNYDIAAGGFQSSNNYEVELGNFLQAINIADWFGDDSYNYGRGNFSFVPLFSSVASTATLNSQADLNIS
ncbi:lipase family alpha/beta hydrolase [Chondrinema litorale]|uniref:lipase family alpha/beta hydrolase n=1 Tax=Chondrinema litorale TaxID=2994555 RepID=UPI002543B613|nr:hypothetical protein [Chondrinema litorale]UZR99803.1 hypothetical protein OQ292_38525 [Chondrinema litorale]